MQVVTVVHRQSITNQSVGIDWARFLYHACSLAMLFEANSSRTRLLSWQRRVYRQLLHPHCQALVPLSFMDGMDLIQTPGRERDNGRRYWRSAPEACRVCPWFYRCSSTSFGVSARLSASFLPQFRCCLLVWSKQRLECVFPLQHNCTTKVTKHVRPTQLLTIGWFDVIATKTELWGRSRRVWNNHFPVSWWLLQCNIVILEFL